MATPFASNCLNGARRTPELCGGVPSLQVGDQGKSWRQNRCGGVIGGSTSEACEGIFWIVQENCAERR